MESGNPYGDDTYGWSPDPAYYQRALPTAPTKLLQIETNRTSPSGLREWKLMKVNALSNWPGIDNDASIRAGQLALPPVVLDTDGDGFVDETF